MKTKWNKRLKLRRVELDLTQKKAADKIGVALCTYQRWEKGSNEPMEVHKKMIAEAFEVDQEKFFKKESEEEE